MESIVCDTSKFGQVVHINCGSQLGALLGCNLQYQVAVLFVVMVTYNYDAIWYGKLHPSSTRNCVHK